jgi:hypothetical protein
MALKHISRLAMAVIVAAAFRSGADGLSIASFDKDLDGFEGAIGRTDERPQAGSGAARIANGNEPWVLAARTLPEMDRDMARLRLWARSSDRCNLAVRLTDATGQVHLQRPEFARDGAWHELRIERFDAGEQYESWGGAADRRWHPPAQRLEFVVEGAGTVWVDSIAAELKPDRLPEFAARAALVARGTPRMLADFSDPRQSGFRGGLKVAHAEKGGPESGFGRIENKDQRWVEAVLPLEDLGRDFLDLSLRVRSSDANRLALRLTDATGQSFQQRLSVVTDGQWQTLRLTRFDGGEIWGGAGDRQWHPPAKALALVLEQHGTVDIDDVAALLHPDVVVPDLAIAPMAFGNILDSGTPVALTVTSKAERVTWQVTDFWHASVASGIVAVAGSTATIRPDVTASGYYLMHLRAETGGQALPQGDRYVSFAIVPGHAPRDRASSPFGVMTHFAQGMDPAILPLFARIGIVSIRDEHYWAQVEKQPGVYKFPERSDAYMAACRANGIDPLIAMTFGNPLYDHADGPSTPAGFEGYGNYGQAILKQYGDQIRWLEIWNEYNGSWAPPSARESLESRYTTYTAMLKAAYGKIKALRPDVQVLGGACVLIPLPYLEGIFKLGGLDYMDAVVIHPYRGQPEGVEREVDELQALIRKYNDGKDKPIWVTETGQHAQKSFDWEAGKGLFEKGRQDGARYLTRMYTLLLTRHVARIYWYLAGDHMEFVSMGLLRRANDPAGPYAVAPSYVTYATLIRQLDGAEFVRREAQRPYTRAHVYLFTRDNAETRVCWATQPAKIRVRANGPLTRVDIVGNTTTIAPRPEGVLLDLNEDAFYLQGKVAAIEEVDTGARIIGDAQDDYTKTQGDNNWYYGYYDGDGQGRGDGQAPNGPYGDDDFKEMTQKETMWGVDWAGPMQYLALSRGSMHPANANGRAVWAVLRWKSPLAGKVRLVGDATRFERGKGDGVTVHLLLNGKPVFEQAIGGAGGAATATFDLPVAVTPGALVDLAIDPRGNTEYDATGYHLRILQEN